MKAINTLTTTALLSLLGIAQSSAVALFSSETQEFGGGFDFDPPTMAELPNEIRPTTEAIALTFSQYNGPASLAFIRISYTAVVKGGAMNLDNDDAVASTGSISASGLLILTGPSSYTSIPGYSFSAGPFTVDPHTADPGDDTLPTSPPNGTIVPFDPMSPPPPGTDAILVDLNDTAAFPTAIDNVSDTDVISDVGLFAPFIGAGTFDINKSGTSSLVFSGMGNIASSQNSSWSAGEVTVEYFINTVPEPSTNAAIAIGVLGTIALVRRARRNKKAAQTEEA